MKQQLHIFVAVLNACLLCSACGSRGSREENFAKKLTEIMQRSDPAARAETHGATLLVHSLKDSCAGFLNLVLRGEFGGAKEMAPADLRESGLDRVECQRTNGTSIGVDLSKLDLAYDTVKKYALEAYPSWVSYSGKLGCPSKLEVLNEYLTSNSISDPLGWNIQDAV